MPDVAITAQDQTRETPLCACGATERHPTATDRCARGHVLVGNVAARTHGVRAFEARGNAALPGDVRLSVDEFRAQVVRDRGGVENLTAIEMAYVRRLSELETVARLLASDLAGRGIFTARGRVRNTFSKWIDAVTAWDRFAQRIGVDGRKPVLTLSQRLAAAPLEDAQNGSHQLQSQHVSTSMNNTTSEGDAHESTV